MTKHININKTKQKRTQTLKEERNDKKQQKQQNIQKKNKTTQ